jgi:hypothetical protein
MDQSSLDDDRYFFRNHSSLKTIESLQRRNRGLLDQNPVQDYFDNNPLMDLPIDNHNMFGSSLGTVSNSKSIYDDATSDILTQMSKHSPNKSVNMPIYFNFIENYGNREIDYSSSDNFILENFFDTIYKTKPILKKRKLLYNN